MLFGFDQLERERPVIVVEGVFDSIRMWSYGYPNVAIFGAELREAQARLLQQKKPPEVTFLLDSGTSAAATRSAIRYLSRFPIVKVASLDGGDPDDSGRKAIATALAAARSIEGITDGLVASLDGLRNPW